MPPPFRFAPFPFRTSPFLFLVLFFFLFALPACPEPPLQSDGSSEKTEGGVEKTEPTAESTPEESANPEESVRPEREPLPEYQLEKPEAPDTTQPTITAIEGDGEKRDIVFPIGQSEPAGAKKSRPSLPYRLARSRCQSLSDRVLAASISRQIKDFSTYDS